MAKEHTGLRIFPFAEIQNRRESTLIWETIYSGIFWSRIFIESRPFYRGPSNKAKEDIYSKPLLC